jgi:alginate O-acetyltransferase complex protein AlgI
MLGYTYQLYFDFSGYSDMAVGLGQLFGLRLPQNFNSPYKALDPSDFWRRWHISLSTVLRDYLYIPLGGSRKGEGRTYLNLMITMLLGGLWHGANWTFVAWGAYHGAMLSLTRAAGPHLEKWSPGFRRAFTFLLVIIGWVMFRADSFTMALGLLRRMLSWSPGVLPVAWPTLVVALVIAAGVANLAPNTFELSHQWGPWTSVALALLFAACLVVIYGGQNSPFLYFQILRIFMQLRTLAPLVILATLVTDGAMRSLSDDQTLCSHLSRSVQCLFPIAERRRPCSPKRGHLFQHSCCQP